MENISEVTAAVVAVPYSSTDFYFYNEILSEGNHRKNVPFIPLINREGLPDKYDYHEVVLTFMQKLRQHHEPQYPIDVDGIKIDIGLIDIQVFFSGSKNLILNTLKECPDVLFKENLKKVEAITDKAIRNQMMMGCCFHSFSHTGEFNFHYHNIIFGIRIENKVYTDINFDEIMRTIAKNGYNVGFVAPNYSMPHVSQTPTRKSKIKQFIDDKILSLIS